MDAHTDQPELDPRVPLGGDYWGAEPAAGLWGFADTHAHLMAHLAFGGKAFWGEPYDPDHPGPEGIEFALSSCEPVHGGLINVNPEFGHPASGGWPEFIVWPRFTTLVHQQAYIDWLHRAYLGGLRLICCLAVNNELLATKTTPRLAHDDKSAIETQLTAMKAMARFVDDLAGGPGNGWLQIVYSPEEARQVVGQNRLAVVLGVEVDSLGNWHNVDDFEKLCQGDLDKARQLIGQELDWLHQLGVRQITPIHLTNNAFGGTAIYMRFLEMVNLFVNGDRWTVENAWDTGVRYRLDHDGADLVDAAERTVAVSGRHMRAMHRRTLLDHIPGIRDLFEASEAPKVHGGHANALGLNRYGHILLRELMKRGFIIDVDHMSEKSTDAALDLAEELDYPVICSHTWFRDLLFSAQTEFDPEKQEHYGTSDVHKVAHEAGKRGDQIERIGRLGGIVAPIVNQGDIAGLRRGLPASAGKIAEPCAGSSTSLAQAYLYAVAKMGGRGVALGSDINGAAGLPGPRFGTFAAFGAHNDAGRLPQRRSEIERQANGVAYSSPMRDHRWHRFESSGAGGYDEQECDIWQAIAQYVCGFNPLEQDHPETDFPDHNVRQALELAKVVHEQGWVDNVTAGFWLADQSEEFTEDQISQWPSEQHAAYLARKDLPVSGGSLGKSTLELIHRIRAIWERWGEMQGDNRPLVRSSAGPRRDFDINLDGMAHYGMFPDLLQDMRNVGLSAEDFRPLFRSAHDYVETWLTCENRAKEISTTVEPE